MLPQLKILNATMNERRRPKKIKQEGGGKVLFVVKRGVNNLFNKALSFSA